MDELIDSLCSIRLLCLDKNQINESFDFYKHISNADNEVSQYYFSCIDYFITSKKRVRISFIKNLAGLNYLLIGTKLEGYNIKKAFRTVNWLKNLAHNIEILHKNVNISELKDLMDRYFYYKDYFYKYSL